MKLRGSICKPIVTGKADIRNAKYFDLEGFHPNIGKDKSFGKKSAKSSKHDMIKYVTKDGDYIEFEDMLGALVVDYNGTRLGVGSGFTEPQRRHIWDNAQVYIGRKIEIDSFGESTNMMGTKSLNCPIFKRFVGDEE